MFRDVETLTDEQYDALMADAPYDVPEMTDAELDEMFREWEAEQNAEHVLFPEPW